VLDNILTDDPDWVNKVKRTGDQQHKSPFDKRGEYTDRVPPNPGIVSNDPSGPVDEDPDDIEVSFHSQDATLDICQAYLDVTNIAIP